MEKIVRVFSTNANGVEEEVSHFKDAGRALKSFMVRVNSNLESDWKNADNKQELWEMLR